MKRVSVSRRMGEAKLLDLDTRGLQIVETLRALWVNFRSGLYLQQYKKADGDCILEFVRGYHTMCFHQSIAQLLPASPMPIYQAHHT